MQSQPLASELSAMVEKMARSLITIDRHAEYTIQTDLIVEHELGPNPNQNKVNLWISMQFQKDMKAFS